MTVDLRSLIEHSAKVPGDMMVEMVQSEFARTNADFLAVVDGDELLGLCARRERFKRWARVLDSRSMHASRYAYISWRRQSE